MMRVRLNSMILLGWVCCAGCRNHDPYIADQTLSLQTIERAGQSWRLAMNPGDFAFLELEQIGADLKMELTDPKGQKRFSMDTRQGGQGVEAFGFIAEEQGAYLLDIIPLTPEEGGFSLKVHGPRKPTEIDKARASASEFMELAARSGEAGDWEASADFFQQAEQRWAVAGDLFQQALAAWEKAMVLGKLGEQGRQLEELTQVVARLEAMGEKPLRSRVLNQLGTLSAGTGRFETAIDYFNHALDLRRDHNLNRAITLQNKAYAYRCMGACQKAVALLKEAEQIQELVGTQASRADWFNHMGTTHLKCGEALAAIPFLEKASELGDARLGALILTRLGQAYIETSRYNLALSTYETILAQLPESLASWRPSQLYYKGIALNHLGRHEEALVDLRAAEAAFRARDSRDELYYALLACSRAEWGLGNQVQALEDVHKALGYLEQTRSHTRSALLKQNYLAFRYAGLDLLTDYTLGSSAGDASELLALLDRFRARGLLESFSHTVPDPQTRAELEALSRRISEIEWRRISEAAKAEPQLEQLSVSLLIEYEQALTQAQQHIPLPSESMEGLDLEEMTQLLGKEDLVLFYAMGEKQVQLLALDRDGLESYELGPRNLIEADILDYSDYAKRRDFRRFEDQLKVLAQRLAGLLPATLLERTEARRLILIPDGVLHYLPFSALTPFRDSSPLVSRFEVVYLPSLATLKALRERERSPAPIFTLFANPVQDNQLFQDLPYAEAEVNRLAAMTPRADIYNGYSASKTLILSGALQQSRLIHFATHGLIHPNHHELSAIILAGVNSQGQPQDPFLRVQDIAGLRLSADLVVLSACETGLGEKIRGEGLAGLPQAFLKAGASSVLVSLWDIDDQAAMTFMEAFYKHLRQHNPSKSLQLAQRDMIAHATWRAPYYWSGFRLMGDWRVMPGRLLTEQNQ